MSFLYSDSEIEEIKKRAIADYLIEHNEILKDRWIPCSEQLLEEHDPIEIKKAREQGRNDAWEMARRLFLSEDDRGYSKEQMTAFFGPQASAYDLIKDNTYAEVLVKINAWEEVYNVKANQVWYHDGMGLHCIVTKVTPDDIHVLLQNGNVCKYERNTFAKTYTFTGDTVDVAALFNGKFKED